MKGKSWKSITRTSTNYCSTFESKMADRRDLNLLNDTRIYPISSIQDYQIDYSIRGDAQKDSFDGCPSLLFGFSCLQLVFVNKYNIKVCLFMKGSTISSQDRYLDSSQIFSKISPDEEESITCKICMGIVIHPSECKTCENVFCSHEVMSEGSYKPCPLCKSISWKYGSEIHKSYKSKLSSLVVKCEYHPECNSIEYTYDKYISHLESKKLEKPVERGYYLFSYEDSGKWEPYDESINSACNLYLQDDMAKFVVCGYEIDVEKMIQINSKTKFERKIRMELDKKRVPKPLWIAEVESLKYQPYGSDTNQELEKIFQQFLQGKRKQTVIQVGKYFYEVDFKLMKQTNSISKTSRRIKRIIV